MAAESSGGEDGGFSVGSGGSSGGGGGGGGGGRRRGGNTCAHEFGKDAIFEIRGPMLKPSLEGICIHCGEYVKQCEICNVKLLYPKPDEKFLTQNHKEDRRSSSYRKSKFHNQHMQKNHPEAFEERKEISMKRKLRGKPSVAPQAAAGSGTESYDMWADNCELEVGESECDEWDTFLSLSPLLDSNTCTSSDEDNFEWRQNNVLESSLSLSACNSESSPFRLDCGDGECDTGSSPLLGASGGNGGGGNDGGGNVEGDSRGSGGDRDEDGLRSEDGRTIARKRCDETFERLVSKQDQPRPADLQARTEIDGNRARQAELVPLWRFNYGHAEELFTASRIAAQSIVGASDKRLKDVEAPLGSGWLERLRRLEVVTYSWKESGKADVGIIAQVGEDVV